MTPELMELLASAEMLIPRERAVVWALGEAAPEMLTLAQIADVSGAHVSGFASAAAALRARRFIRCEDNPGAAFGAGGAPLYRLLARGQDAYTELQHDREHRARRWQPPARRIGAAA